MCIYVCVDLFMTPVSDYQSFQWVAAPVCCWNWVIIMWSEWAEGGNYFIQRIPFTKYSTFPHLFQDMFFFFFVSCEGLPSPVQIFLDKFCYYILLCAPFCPSLSPVRSTVFFLLPFPLSHYLISLKLQLPSL